MRFLKLAVISLVIFTGLLVLISFLIPSSVRVTRAISIRGDSSLLKKELNNLAAWPRWNEMIQSPNLTHVKISAGHFYSDELQINVTDTAAMKTAWIQKGRQGVEAAFHFIPSSGNEVILKWQFVFHLRWYPWEKFGSIVIERQVGGTMERSLNNFKKSLEDSM
ncbi:MAG TPA: hypothetical protein VM012_12945 [Flavitalea sp.]|nr:hypothetical protein [Flavitalea sp.]